MTLEEIGRIHGTDKVEHGYLPHYEQHLPDCDSQFTLLEIGIATGASLRMWHDWAINAQIVGIDNNPDVKDIPEEGFKIIHGDATEQFEMPYTSFDVIIDDGSHQSTDIIKSFDLLWSKLKIGGWYIIEDLETQFHEEWGGSYSGSPATTKIYTELLNTIQNRYNSELHVYEQMVFIRKGKK